MEFNCKYVHEDGSTASWKGEIRAAKKQGCLTEAQVTGRGSSFTIILGRYANGNFLCIPEIDVGCPLSDWSDAFWNLERLSPLMNPVDATTVVYGIRALSEMRG